MSDQPFKSEFLQTLQARGYIHQVTHPQELDQAALADHGPGALAAGKGGHGPDAEEVQKLKDLHGRATRAA